LRQIAGLGQLLKTFESVLLTRSPADKINGHSVALTCRSTYFREVDMSSNFLADGHLIGDQTFGFNPAH
jgi:hypothetical protein